MTERMKSQIKRKAAEISFISVARLIGSHAESSSTAEETFHQSMCIKCFHYQKKTVYPSFIPSPVVVYTLSCCTLCVIYIEYLHISCHQFIISINVKNLGFFL